MDLNFVISGDICDISIVKVLVSDFKVFIVDNIFMID